MSPRQYGGVPGYGLCSYCGRWFRLRSEELNVWHRAPIAQDRWTCPGYGLPVSEFSEFRSFYERPAPTRKICDCGLPVHGYYGARQSCVLCNLLDGRTEAQRRIITLMRSLGGLTVRQIAEETRVSYNTAQKQLIRMRDRGIIRSRPEEVRSSRLRFTRNVYYVASLCLEDLGGDLRCVRHRGHDDRCASAIELSLFLDLVRVARATQRRR